MTPEEINQACAELCGWKHVVYTPARQVSASPYNVWIPSTHVGVRPIDDEGDGKRGIPNFTDSLEAAQMAFNALDENSKVYAIGSLLKMLNLQCAFVVGITSVVELMTKITPAQWCEVTLKAVGKWREE